MKVGDLIIGAMGVLFIGLKLTGHIDWSWWWVLAPFWVPWALIALLLTAAAVMSVVQKRMQ